MLIPVNEGYLPIGRFARLCRLSVKQLRNYDDLGLLVPAHVDPDTGYRYYRPGQSRDALVIGLLRSLDVPLPAIARVLADGTGALGGVRDAMEADLARRQRNLAALEGRWWVEDERSPFDVPREEWHWHLFLRLPDTVEDAWYDEARQAAPHPAAPRVQLVTYTEGRCVQVLHRGAYADEPRTLARMDAYLEQERLTGNGLHHEVYLSDVRETGPEKLRTILRLPVRPSV